MDLQKETLSALAQQIDHLRATICPEKFRYTHEFLQLAFVAAQREDDDVDTITLAQPMTTH